MKKVFSLLCACIFTLSAINLSAAENAAQAEQKGENVDIAMQINDCDFKCPYKGYKETKVCFEVDNCKEYPVEKIKELVKEIYIDCCTKLQECCKEQGCEEFACELYKYDWDCVSENKLCIYVVVAFKCG